MQAYLLNVLVATMKEWTTFLQNILPFICQQVKYRKHKKGNRGAGKAEKGNNGNINNNGSAVNLNPMSNGNGPSNNSMNGAQNNSHPNGLAAHPGLPHNLPAQNGNILMAALTSPNEVRSMRQVLPVEQALNMTNSLVQCDNLHDIAALHVSQHYHIPIVKRINGLN